METIVVLYFMGLFLIGLFLPAYLSEVETLIHVPKIFAYVVLWPLVFVYFVIIGAIAIVKDMAIK